MVDRYAGVVDWIVAVLVAVIGPGRGAPAAPALRRPGRLARWGSAARRGDSEDQRATADVVEDVLACREHVLQVVGVVSRQAKDFLPRALVQHELQGVGAVDARLLAGDPGELVVRDVADLDAVVVTAGAVTGSAPSLEACEMMVSHLPTCGRNHLFCELWAMRRRPP